MMLCCNFYKKYADVREKKKQKQMFKNQEKS